MYVLPISRKMGIFLIWGFSNKMGQTLLFFFQFHLALVKFVRTKVKVKKSLTRTLLELYRWTMHPFTDQPLRDRVKPIPWSKK